MHYVIEETPTGFSAYIPALPGCVAAGESREETFDLLSEAALAHVTALVLTSNLSVSASPGMTTAAPTLGVHQLSLGQENNLNSCPA